MNLTLFCDASFCPKTKVAGWGAWAKRMEWIEGLIFGGAFKRTFDNNHEAELCAIANALFVLKEEGHLTGITNVMIQSDSLRSLGLIKLKLPSAQIRDHADGASILKGVGKSMTETEGVGLSLITKVWSGSFDIQLRHVRGHRQGPSRQWVNRQCDATAKGHMRDRRDAVLIGKGE